MQRRTDVVRVLEDTINTINNKYRINTQLIHKKCTQSEAKVRYSRHLGGKELGSRGRSWESWESWEESRRYPQVAYRTRVEHVTKSISPLNVHYSPYHCT